MKRLFSFAILTLALTAMAQAQYRPSGPPASVTSPNPNTGSVFNGAGPTVTSGSFSPVIPHNLAHPRRHGAFGREHRGGGGHGRFGTPFAPLWAYSPTLIPVPVPVDADGNPIAMTDTPPEEEDDRPAYTVFEHRNRIAIPPTDTYERRTWGNTQAEAAPEPMPVQDQPATLLVFRDGHQLEITNYAIQSGTLFNLSDNGLRKIALADLDVDKTVKANDERGVDFTVPATR